MPSPIAHCSVALLAWPALRPEAATAAPWRRAAVLGAMLFMFIAPDTDILLGMLFGAGPFRDHGGATHSILAAVLWGVPFALFCRWILHGGPLFRFWLIGFFACASHLLLDACTFGRGVMMFWPWDQRIRLPVVLFVGVRHSSPAQIVDHLFTIVTELLFAVLLWRVVRMIKPRKDRAAPGEQRPAGLNPITPAPAEEP